MHHRSMISLAMTRTLALCGMTAGVIMLAGCGSGSPNTPDPTDRIVATGSQIFRMTLQSPCAAVSRDFFPIVYTRVTVSDTGGEWTVTANTAAAGDLELHFHRSSARSLANSMEVTGTIKGIAVHLPELAPGPSWEARASFGTQAPTTITGVAFAPGFLGAQAGGLDGIGSGSVVVGDTSGHTCTGSSFSWSIFPPQGQAN